MDLFYWTNLLWLSEWIIRLVFLPLVVLRKDHPSTCLAWMAIVFFEPWVGLGLYVLIGENRLGRRRLRRRKLRRLEYAPTELADVAEQHVARPYERDDYNVLVQMAESVGGLPAVSGNCVEFFDDTDRAIERLIAEIDAAQHHVHLLFFIYRDDDMGVRVAEAMLRARRRGVTCRLLADHIGSRRFFGGDLLSRLTAAGVEVHPVLPARLWRLPFARLDLRNHRKLAVIDGRVAFTGSQNIVHEEFGHRRAGAWYDIMARLTGPVVRQLQAIFLDDWFQETGQRLRDRALFPEPAVTGGETLQVIPTGPDLPTGEFRDLIVKALFMAQRHIVITSPYFVPSDAMMLALRLARQRGVEVEIVVPRRSNHPIVDAAGAYYLEKLADIGVKVHLFREGMLHSKVMTIDDDLALFGSANYDVRSFDLNFELNLLLHATPAVAAIHALQRSYIARSVPATAHWWPSRTFWGRLKVNLAKLLSPLL